MEHAFDEGQKSYIKSNEAEDSSLNNVCNNENISC